MPLQMIGSGGQALLSAQATTGSVAGAALATVVVPLPRTMPNANYTCVPSVEDSSGDLAVRGVVVRTTTSVSIRVINNSAVMARTGTVHVLVHTT